MDNENEQTESKDWRDPHAPTLSVTDRQTYLDERAAKIDADLLADHEARIAAGEDEPVVEPVVTTVDTSGQTNTGDDLHEEGCALEDDLHDGPCKDSNGEDLAPALEVQ
jgi:hypothetical protein